MKRKAFSLVELSIVTLVIGILIAGLVQGSRLYKSIMTPKIWTKFPFYYRTKFMDFIHKFFHY
ncbi:MAG: type II secretion system protein [Pelagibacterales bacterium]|nr:type II secretion system protein [Pelagibacterales bacterium]